MGIGDSALASPLFHDLNGLLTSRPPSPLTYAYVLGSTTYYSTKSCTFRSLTFSDPFTCDGVSLGVF